MASRRHESLIPLSHDHRDALALAFQLHHPSPPGPATAVTPASTPASRAAEVLDFLAAELEAHFRAEEEVLFPAIAAHLPADAPAATLLRDLIADHRRLEELGRAIASGAAAGERAGDDVLAAPLCEFADVLERHVRREERELFARLASLVPAAEAAQLGPRIRASLEARPPRTCPGPATAKP